MPLRKPDDEHVDGGYLRRHKLVRKARGHADEHTCSCGKPAQEWAHVHDTDPNDVFNYQAMCRPCHRKYDDSANKSSIAQKGKPRPDVSTWMKNNKNASGKRTPEQCERIRAARWGERRPS